MKNKTVETKLSVDDYINSITNAERRTDVRSLVSIFTDITKTKPVMWGTSIIGFGKYHYRYDSGREGDSPRLGISNRVNAITIYGLIFYDITHENNVLLDKIGPHKNGKGCLYIKNLAEIDIKILKTMASNAFNTKL